MDDVTSDKFIQFSRFYAILKAFSSNTIIKYFKLICSYNCSADLENLISLPLTGNIILCTLKNFRCYLQAVSTHVLEDSTLEI